MSMVNWPEWTSSVLPVRWPDGYFEQTAGALAGENIERLPIVFTSPCRLVRQEAMFFN